MCGIMGLLHHPAENIEAVAVSMRDVFTYRGPDDKGLWLDKSSNVVLGHRRLSILDTTSSGHQPMLDQSARCCIVFNGEVYNYIEIRSVLQEKGYIFKTKTDTEVVLNAYLEYGYECLQHFNGMFAIAIWDKKTQKLFLGRDRLGIKPLYYCWDGHSFLFASESKAIVRVLGKKPTINVQLIDQYLSFGYIPGEDTLHNGIKRLLPGHCAIFDANASHLKIKKYWDVSFQNGVDRGLDYYLEKSKTLLNSAIDLRLRSDVPLGIFLSGGIDSAAVVGLLAQRVSDPLKTFSVAYDFGRNFDETHYAAMVAKKFNTDHHEIFIKPNQFRDFIPEFIHLMDEPVTEAAAISLYFLSKQAKNKVTVVLSGEGSDEIFAGYDLYRYMLMIEHYRAFLGANFSKYIKSIATHVLRKKNKLSKYMTLGGLPLEQRYKGISTYEEYHKNLLYRPEFKHMVEKQRDNSANEFLQSLFSSTKALDPLSRMLYFDTKTWLADDLLIKADRMSMAASLELRVPFLDFRLVEFAATIPSKYKIKNNQGKYLLKEMMRGILPEKIIYRKKMGFPTPLKLMFQNEMKDYAGDLLLPSNAKIQAYFCKNRINQLLVEHNANRQDHHRILWQLVVLEEWLKNNTG